MTSSQKTSSQKSLLAYLKPSSFRFTCQYRQVRTLQLHHSFSRRHTWRNPDSLYCKLLLSSKEIAMANTATHVSVSNLVSLPAYMAVREAKRAQVTLKKTVSWLQPRFVSSAVSRAQVSKQAITRSLCDAFGGSRCSTSTKNFVGRNIRVSKYVLSGRCP